MDPIFAGMTAALLVLLQAAALYRSEILGSEEGGDDSLFEAFRIPQRDPTSDGKPSFKHPAAAFITSATASLTVQSQIAVCTRPWRGVINLHFLEPGATIIIVMCYVAATMTFPLSEWLGNLPSKRVRSVATMPGISRLLKPRSVVLLWLGVVAVAHLGRADGMRREFSPCDARFSGFLRGAEFTVWMRADRSPRDGRLPVQLILSYGGMPAREQFAELELASGAMVGTSAYFGAPRFFEPKGLGLRSEKPVLLLEDDQHGSVVLEEVGSSRIDEMLSLSRVNTRD